MVRKAGRVTAEDGSRAGRLMPAAVVAAALALYCVSLAPGLLWGDSAKFQRMAWQGDIRFDTTGHPLWVALVHPLASIPGLDPARAGNLSSAILSALALWPLIRIVRRLGASEPAAAIAALSLTCSHTFWFHAVITEVYALNTLLALAILDGVLELARRAREGRPVAARCFGLGLLAGIASGNHLLALLWLPGLAWLAGSGLRAARNRAAAGLWAACGLTVGIAPFLLLRATIHARAETLDALASRLARQAFSPEALPGDLLLGAAYLLYQFPVPVILAAAAIGTIRLWKGARAEAAGLLILYAAGTLFATTFQVRDRFAFYLPSYLVVAILAGCGIDAVLARVRAWRIPAAAAAIGLALACLAAPPLLYRAAPLAAGRLLAGMGPRARDIPYRDAARYHLYPGKAGDDGARRFASESFEVARPEALLIADYTLQQPLLYAQSVEGARPDVEVLYVSPRWQLDLALRESARGRPIYLAAADAYYDAAGIATRFRLEPAGPLLHLVPR